MNIIELIRKKRDGYSLRKDEIDFLVSGYSKNKIPDYQFSAFLMSAFIRGFNSEEPAYLNSSMINCMKVLNLKSINGIKVDIQSTGRVGDKTSLIIAPVAAAAVDK